VSITGIDFTASRLRWHNLILRWSNSNTAILRTVGSPDRPCVACVGEFSPQEKMGAAINPEASKAMVSGLAPDGVTPIDIVQEGTSLIIVNPDGTEQPVYKMVAKPQRAEPTPGLVVAWVLQVRR
jgi:hypothetical protein